MTNSLAVILGSIIVAAIVADVALLDGANVIFLGKKLLVLLEYMAFWR